MLPSGKLTGAGANVGAGVSLFSAQILHQPYIVSVNFEPESSGGWRQSDLPETISQTWTHHTAWVSLRKYGDNQAGASLPVDYGTIRPPLINRSRKNLAKRPFAQRVLGSIRLRASPHQPRRCSPCNRRRLHWPRRSQSPSALLVRRIASSEFVR